MDSDKKPQRKKRTVFQTEEDRLAAKKANDRKRNRTRIQIGPQIVRWQRLQNAFHFPNSVKTAQFLLDWYQASVNKVGENTTIIACKKCATIQTVADTQISPDSPSYDRTAAGDEEYGSTNSDMDMISEEKPVQNFTVEDELLQFPVLGRAQEPSPSAIYVMPEYQQTRPSQERGNVCGTTSISQKQDVAYQLPSSNLLPPADVGRQPTDGGVDIVGLNSVLVNQQQDMISRIKQEVVDTDTAQEGSPEGTFTSETSSDDSDIDEEPNPATISFTNQVMDTEMKTSSSQANNNNDLPLMSELYMKVEDEQMNIDTASDENEEYREHDGSDEDDRKFTTLYTRNSGDEEYTPETTPGGQPRRRAAARSLQKQRKSLSLLEGCEKDCVPKKKCSKQLDDDFDAASISSSACSEVRVDEGISNNDSDQFEVNYENSKMNEIVNNIGTNTLECEICNFSCKMESTLAWHRYKTHGDSEGVKSCDLCNEKFRYRSELFSHRNKMHKDAPKLKRVRKKKKVPTATLR